MWSFRLHDTLSGAFRLEVQPSKGRWRSSLTQPGSGEHTLQLRDAETAMPRDVVRAETRPWARTLVVCWDGVPVYAGLITGRTYSRKTGALQVQHIELAWLLRRRHLFSLDEFNPGASLTLAGKSMRGIVRGVIRAGLWRPDAPFWTMPIDYPADEAGSTSLTWWHYQGKSAQEMIDEVSRMSGSPDWWLRPTLVSGVLRWQLEIGSPLLASTDLVEIPAATETAGIDITVIEDGLDQLTGALALGQGAEADVLWRVQAHRSPLDKPILDETFSEKSVSDLSQLQRLATGRMDQRETIQSQYDLSVVGDAETSLASIHPGTRFRLWSHGDEFEPDGKVDLYTLAVSGDMSHVVKPEVVPV